MSFPLTDLLVPERVLLHFDAANETEAIRTVTGVLQGHPDVADVQRLTRDVVERESLSSTAMGHGVAFPHARTDQVRRIVMAIGRSPAGVPFKSAADPVHFVFIIGTPQNEVPQYLAAVGKLARTLKDASVREQLMAATSVEEFLAALKGE
jgi:mannitol/fructose-specific phosphotransferase system IIA component (Ntr-type)